MTAEGFVMALIAGLGTSAVSRVYMLKLPQLPTTPAVRVQRISNPRDQHLRGPDGHQITRVQVDSYATDYFTAETLAAAIRGDGKGSGLWGWTGQIGSPPITVMNVELPFDGTPEEEPAEKNLVRIRQDYLVHWK